MKHANMTSNRPYLIRAFYQWLVDNGQTPYLLVDAEHDRVTLPRGFVNEGRIVLNINPSAVTHLDLGNDWISFNARFNGIVEQVMAPPSAVLGIYAKESGRGMLFPSDEDTEDDKPEPPNKGGPPPLKVVK